MSKVFNSVDEIFFEVTRFSAVIAVIVSVYFTLFLRRYEISFTIMLLVLATLFSIAQTLFAYQKNHDSDTGKKNINLAAEHFMKSAIWLAMAAVIICLYFVEEVFLYTSFWASGAIRYSLLILSLINIIYSMLHLNRALNNVKFILFNDK